MRRIALFLLWLCLAVLPVAAQQATPDQIARQIEQWAAAATSAEGQIANPSASNRFLEQIRVAMLEQRGRAIALRDQAQERVRPLRIQLDALGAAPEGTGVEAPEIAEQRRQLTEAMAAAEAPVKAAEAAYRRADAIVSRIDEVIRNRFREELLAQQPSPLNPTNWLGVISELTDRTLQAVNDAAEGLQSMAQGGWAALVSGALGVILLVGVRRRVVSWFQKRLAPATEDGSGQRVAWAAGGHAIAAFLIPALGCALLLFALRGSGMINGVAAPYLREANVLFAAMILAYWLAETLFGADVPARDLMPMTPRQARRAARMTIFLGLVVGLDRVLVSGSAAAWLTLEALSLHNFVLVCIGAFALWRLGSAMQAEPAQPLAGDSEAEDGPDAAAPNPLGQVVRRLTVRAAKLFALAAPVLAAFGFYAASRLAFYPVVLTGALLGVALVLVALVNNWVTSRLHASGQDSRPHAPLRLLPVAAGFGLACIGVPVLALIWGARESDLSQAWSLMTDGVPLGETRISPLDFLTLGFIFAAGFTLTRLVQSVLKGTVLPQTSLDSGGRMAIVSMLGYLGIVLSALAAVAATGIDLSNLAIVAGGLSLGLGFGLQNVVSNFVSGVILLIERPVKEGDWVRVGEFEGTVKRISVRATTVQTFDRAIVTVPNAEFITTPVLNRTHTSTTGRLLVPIGVAYGSDTRKVEEVLKDIAASCDMLLRRPAPIIAFRGFGKDALNFEIVGYLRDVNNIVLAANFLNHAIAERFPAEGIEIPFSQTDVRIRDIDGVIAALTAAARKGEETTP